MEGLIYYRNIENLPPAPICNVILNGKLIYEEFLMSTILELILNKNIEVKDDKLYFVKSDNVTEYQFDVINLLFNRFDTDRILEQDVLFVRKSETHCLVDKEYRELFDLLEQEAKKNNTAPYIIYKKTINNLILNHNIIYHKTKLGIFRTKLGGFEFVTLCNTTNLEKKIILYSFVNLDKLTGKSIKLQEIKDLYINKFAIEKIKHWKSYFKNILVKKLCAEGIYNSNMKTLTTKGKKIKEKVMALKNFIKDYSFLEKKDFENYILWGEYLSYATALGICRKIEKIAENYTIQIDDIIESIKQLSNF